MRFFVRPEPGLPDFRPGGAKVLHEHPRLKLGNRCPGCDLAIEKHLALEYAPDSFLPWNYRP